MSNLGLSGGADLLLRRVMMLTEQEEPLTNLTFTVTQAGTIIWKATKSTGRKTIKYKKNSGSWTNWQASTSGNSISVSVGDTIELTGTNTSYYNNGEYSYFSGTAKFEASGSIMSLLGNANSKVISSEYAFYSLFRDCTGIIRPPLLPAKTLSKSCYSYLFYNCTNLIEAPELPATTLANYCYMYMFNGCTSLTESPELPALTGGPNSYSNMFSSSGIISAGKIFATALDSYCCSSMFSNCTALRNAPEMHVTTLNSYCCQYMFQNCSSLVSAPQLPATTLEQFCYNSMFKNCTSLTTAPILPATSLKTACYMEMFYGCTNLTYIKAMFTTNPQISSNVSDWVTGVSSSGTFVKNAAATWNNEDAVPSGWTVQTASS